MAAYFNTASFGIIDPEAKASADAFYQDLAVNASSVSEDWRDNAQPRIRETIAAFLGAAPSQVAMLPNFSWAMNALVHSLDGDERVLLYRGDFPSLLEPFVLNRFDIHWIDSEDSFHLPLEEIKLAIQQRKVDIVALSHVQFNSGYRLPIDQIGTLCQQNGVRFIVDTTQSMGAMPIDVSSFYMDALIGSNYKWMRAGFGTGIMYLSEDFLKRYPPVVGGFGSFTWENGQGSHVLSSRSYEPGHPNMYGLSLLKGAIVGLQAKGLGEIERHNMRLTRLLLDGIRGLDLSLLGGEDLSYRSSILLFKDEENLSGWIKDGGFIVTSRAGRVRISIHHYNTTGEVEALVSWLQKKPI